MLMRFTFPKALLCLLMAVVVFAPPALVFAERAEINRVVIEKGGRELEVSFRLEDCFTTKMEEALHNGLPVTFRILIAIEKSSVMLVKSQVVDFTLKHTIRYDRLNNEYQVQLQEEHDRIRVTEDFNEAKRWMSTVEKLPIINTCWLHKGQEYELKLKAELSKVELPVFLRYILFWVSLWDFETDWQKVTFSM